MIEAKETKNDSALILVIFLAMAAIFILDLFTPLGMADATAYVFPILLCLWSPRKNLVLIVAIICLVLT